MFMMTFMKNCRVKRLTALCTLLMVLGVYWLTIPLCIVVKSDDRATLYLPTFTGDTFSLHFIHSVHKTPVWENFVVGPENQITLVSTEYESYGVGMPFLPEEGTFAQQDNKIQLTNLQRVFAQIPARVGTEAKLSLFHHEKDYPLYQYFEYQALVVISVQYDYFWFLHGHSASW